MVRRLRPRRVKLRRIERKDDSDLVYDTERWQALSRSLRRRHPVCQRCGDALSEHVHHLVPIRLDPSRAYDETNLVCLCAVCHRAEHRGTPLETD